MSTSKLIISLSLCACIIGYAQNIRTQLPQHCEVYVCKNTNNTVEKLYIASLDHSKIWYTHSANPDKIIPLKIVQSTMKNEQGNFTVYEATSYVQFPNSAAKYKLESLSIASNQITCTNPDGSVQVFESHWSLSGAYGTYKNQNGTAYLYLENTGNGKVSIKYASEKDGYKWQNLIVEKINMGDMGHLYNCSVRFPLAKENEYYLKIESAIKNPSFYEITLQQASMTNSPEKYYWINK